jgi:hypothetical protein
MSGPGKPKDRASMGEIEAALEGLLGKLGGTLSDLVEKLESGESGELRRSVTHSISWFSTGSVRLAIRSLR